MRQLFRHLLDRILRWFRTLSQSENAPLTGLLGLAILLFGLYQLRSSRSRSRRQNQASSSVPAGHAHGSHASTAALSSSNPTSNSTQTTDRPLQHTPASQKPSIPGIQIAAGIKSGMAGVQRLSISIPGVLLVEQATQELSETATMKPEVVSIIQQVMCLAQIYFIAQVSDDIGQATVTGALEACGLLGNGPLKLPPHRLLFCSTTEGKISMVRQLEPDLHIDAHAPTLQELQRFMPRLLYIKQAVGSAASSLNTNVGQYDSLEAFFGI